MSSMRGGGRGRSAQSVTQVNYGWKGKKSWVFILFLLVNTPRRMPYHLSKTNRSVE